MKKLGIVIPYRDRWEHLETLLPSLQKWLINIDHEIIVVEQEDGKEFNRGLIKNIGFINLNNCDYFCFHDVDMFPDDADYSFNDGATHLANKVKQFGYTLPYNHYFGGVFLITKDDFIKINGFGNNFIGWGSEDDDLYNRLVYNKILISRRECIFDSADHKRDDKNRIKNWLLLHNCMNSNNYSSGLSDMVYRVISKDNKNISGTDITWLKVSI